MKFVRVAVALAVLFALTVGGAGVVAAADHTPDDGNNGHGNDCDGSDGSNPGNSDGRNDKQGKAHPSCLKKVKK